MALRTSFRLVLETGSVHQVSGKYDFAVVVAVFKNKSKMKISHEHAWRNHCELSSLRR